MTRQQRIHLAQRARSMAYDAWWQALCEQLEFSLYDARKAPRNNSLRSIDKPTEQRTIQPRAAQNVDPNDPGVG